MSGARAQLLAGLIFLAAVHGGAAAQPVALPAAEASVPAPDVEAAARARIAELESTVDQLRQEGANAQQAVAGLRARLQQADEERFNNPLVHGLAALLALLAGATLWLWRQRARDRETHAWLLQAAAEAQAEAAQHARSDDADEDSPTAPAVLSPTKSSLRGSRASGWGDAPRGEGMGRAAEPASVETLLREVSAEELMDLEQQAEFFAVLGQEEAAIELLGRHLEGNAGQSAMPYLKLLELHKRRDEREAYERLREHFNARFNAEAPDWHADLQAGRSLEDYPTVMDRLQRLWSNPTRALRVLQSMLLRARGTDDETEASSFDLPAYRELMLLHSVASDRAQSEARQAVDLLLPLDDEARDGEEGPITVLLPLPPSIDLELDVPAPSSRR